MPFTSGTSPSRRRRPSTSCRAGAVSSVRVVVGHANPDFDAYASTVAGTKLFPGAKGVFLGSQNANVRTFHNLHEEFLKFVDLKTLDMASIDSIVMVDTRDPDRLGELAEVARTVGVEVLARNPDDSDARKRLESLYQENQRWQPLAAMVERWLERNPDDSEAQSKLEAIYHKTQQWQPLGVLYERDLAKNPESVDALNKVEDLYRKSEQWRPLATLLERRAERREPAGARAMRMERASIFIDKLKDFDAALAVARSFAASDPSAAEEIHAKCLDRDPGNTEALLALADLARDKGDHLRAAKFILDAAERTQNPLELGRLFTEAASIYLEPLADESKATELFQRALAADPEQTTAAGRLLPLREKAEDWASAESLIDLLVRKTPDDGSGGKCDLYQRQARNARKLGKTDKAATALEA